MNWVPVFFVTFKLVVFGIGMFFAIRWHYNQEKDKYKVLRTAGMVATIFAASLVGLMFVTFALAKMLGLNMTYPR